MWVKFSEPADHTGTKKHAWNYRECRRGVVVAATAAVVVVVVFSN